MSRSGIVSVVDRAGTRHEFSRAEVLGLRHRYVFVLGRPVGAGEDAPPVVVPFHVDEIDSLTTDTHVGSDEPADGARLMDRYFGHGGDPVPGD